MRVPWDWLAELVPDLPDPETSAELLTGLGLAVETIHRHPGVPAGVVVGEVRASEAIEGSDHLHATTVWDGTREHSVVCGAPNVMVGMRTAFAPPGTDLPAAGFTVGVREMMGVESAGVLCSPRELGVYDWAGGLIVLGADAHPGADLAAAWPDTTVLELELTPNRADAFSVLGVARDLAAKLGRELRHPAAGLEPGGPDAEHYRLDVADPVRCPRMTLRRVEGVAVAPSPLWLQRRLASLGLRPRNNVVDATNYVTFELGQPSHAYDERVLEDATLQVRRAEPGETLVALGDVALELDPEDLVIATPGASPGVSPDASPGGGSRAVGLAGVIGGRDDSVRPDTRAVALEVAHFEPVGVRKTAKRHGLATDAHYRFERGVDPDLPPLASIRTARLIAELAGGEVAEDYAGFGDDAPRAAAEFRPSQVEFLMGFVVPDAEQRRSLEALGCEVETLGDDRWRVTPPSWRFDLAIEEDYVEEVGRLAGFDRIGETYPEMAFTPPETDPTHRALREHLAAAGHQELLSYVFTSDAELERAAAPAAAVQLQHPQGSERSVLRTRLWPALLQAADLNRGAPSLAIFEIGRVFGETEREHLALLWRGPWIEGGWLAPRPTDFYLAKGVLAALAERFGATFEATPVEADAAPHLHPGVAGAVRWNGREVGTLGRLHPEVAARYELGEIYLAELELPLEPGAIRFREVRRQPFAERDLAVVAPRETTFAEIGAVARRAAGAHLETLEPFDVYAGDPIPEGQRSVALRLRFRHDERSLTDAEVDRDMENVIAALKAAGYAIRE